jgi:hypothetical protein
LPPAIAIKGSMTKHWQEFRYDIRKSLRFTAANEKDSNEDWRLSS